MKSVFTAAMLLVCLTSFSQWKRVHQLPTLETFSIFHKDGLLYVGGNNKVYIGRQDGTVWDSTTRITFETNWLVDGIFVFKNDIYATSFNKGVFRSRDSGRTWQNNTAGLYPAVSGFIEWNGELYAATLGNGVYKQKADGKSWLEFNIGLSDINANVFTILGSDKVLIAGAGANGQYLRVENGSANWDEREITGNFAPGVITYKGINANDTLFMSTSANRVYRSTDNGLSWQAFANPVTTTFMDLLNTSEAVIGARRYVNITNNTSFFYKLKNESLQSPWVLFNDSLNFIANAIDVTGDKLWNASWAGLYYMSLSNLPGVHAEKEPVILPTIITSFELKQAGTAAQLTWTTSQEWNNRGFDVERSADGIVFTKIAWVAGNGNTSVLSNYIYSDATIQPGMTYYYRLRQINNDNRSVYSAVRSLKTEDIKIQIRITPNPAQSFLNIYVSGMAGKVDIDLINTAGQVVGRWNNVSAAATFHTTLSHLPAGIYNIIVITGGTYVSKKIVVQ